MEEQSQGDELAARIAPDDIQQVSARGFKNHGWRLRGILGEVRRDRSSNGHAVQDDLLFGDISAGTKILPGGFGVVSHVLLGGMDWGAGAVTAVVEGEDVDAEVVQGAEADVGVGEAAIGSGQEQKGGVGIASTGGGGDPPAG